MRIIGFLLSLLGLAITVYVAADGDMYSISHIFDFWNLMPFVLAYAGVIVGTGSFKAFVMGVNAAISKKYRITDAQRDDAVELFRLLGRMTAYVSAAVVFIGLTMLLTNLNDPGSMGVRTGVILIAFLYGAAIQMLFIQPTIYMLTKRQTEEPARAARIKDKEALNKLAQLCFEKGITLDVDVQPEVAVKGDGEQLKRLVGILADNAFRYADKFVNVTLTASQGQAVLSFANDGPGIAPEEIAKIWERFYRSDKARQYDGGYGLGLPMAKAIAERHKGRITCESEQGVRTEFTVRLPV